MFGALQPSFSMVAQQIAVADNDSQSVNQIVYKGGREAYPN
jgi:hypothetical protein